MSRSPNGLHDKSGWTRINCHAREMVARSHDGLTVGSTLTDPEGHYGSPVVFTEWWWTNGATEFPVLRDYRYQHCDGEPACRHYVASGPESWTDDEA